MEHTDKSPGGHGLLASLNFNLDMDPAIRRRVSSSEQDLSGLPPAFIADSLLAKTYQCIAVCIWGIKW